MAITRGNDSSTLTSASNGGTITWSTNPTAGQTVLVYILESGGETITSVKDNGVTQSTFTEDKGNSSSGGESVLIYRANGISLPSSGNYAVTIVATGGSTVVAHGRAYSGMASGAPTSAITDNGTGTAVTTGAITPSASGSLVVAAFVTNLFATTTISAASGGPTNIFTQVSGASFVPGAAADDITSSGSAITTGWTVGSSAAWGSVAATYAAASVNPTVTAGTPANGTTGVSYSQTAATVSGGSGTYVSVTTGSGALPPGLSLSLSGGNVILSGTPQTAGGYTFTAQVTDSASNTGTSGNISVTITSNLTVLTTSLPGGNVGTFYNQSLSASGGYGSYTWTITVGTLPTGLSLASPTISGTPSGSPGTSSFTVKVTDGGGNTATEPLSIVISAAALLTIVNQWGLADNGGYAPGPVAVSNTEGNALVAIVATGADNVSGFVPRISVADDAHNWWVLASSQVVQLAGANRRLDAWVCANAKAATVISVTTDAIYAGISGFIAEVSGAPPFISVDFFGLDTTGFGAASTLAATATQADLVMSVLALFGSNGPQTVTYPAALTTTFTSISTQSSAADMSDIQLYAAYDPSPVSAGAVSEAWSWGNNAYICGIVVGFAAAPPPPSQPNPNAPAIITEAALGFPPDDQTGQNPTWTDLSTRVIGDPGTASIQSSRGREYELTEPEAGELNILFNNQDGALNPVNTGSAYYPNIVPEVPVRSSFFWNGRRYGVGFSYATSFPQTFPERQWGFVPYTGKDAIGIISQGAMPSAYAGEVLADYAYSYYPFGEYYESPHGAQFGNLSRYNQRPAIGWNPPAIAGTTSAPGDYALSTGLTMGLMGDSASGIGVSGIQSGDASTHGMGGAFVTDNSLPQFFNGAGTVAYEFWSAGVTAGIPGIGPALFAGYGQVPWNYSSNGNGGLVPGEVFAVYLTPAASGLATWYLTVSSRAVNTAGSPGSPTTTTLVGTGTWTVPANVTSINVQAFGAGTGAMGGVAASPAGGNGGAGGAYAATSGITVTPSTVIPYTIGIGGYGGLANDYGFSGTDTSWNSGQVLAKAGTVNRSTGVATGGQASSCVGSTKLSGGNGGLATGNAGAGGGGAPVPPSAAGGAGQSVSGNSGGNAGSQDGARGGNAGSAGNGAGWAGGGGGGGTSQPGGNGGHGVIYVTYTPTVITNNNIIASNNATVPEAVAYHVVVTVTPSGSNSIFTLYVNGNVVTSVTVTPPTLGNLLVNALAVGGATPNQGGDGGLANNYSVGQVAVYPLALSPQRILSHYNVGLNARQNPNGDTTSMRVSGLFQWSGLGVPYGVALADSMTPSALGNADQIQGSALADALYSLSIEEGGMFYCPATANGEVWYSPRQTLYNKLAKAVLGDAPTEISNSNPNFNDALAGWSLAALSGSETADTTVPGGNSATLTVNTGSVTSASAMYESPVTAGQTYTLCGYIEPVTSSTLNLYSIEINWYGSSGLISTSQSAPVNLGNGFWTFVTLGTHAAPVTAPAGATSCLFGPVISVASGDIVINSQFKAGQMWLTCVSSEVPYDAGSGFDYSDTFLYNIVQSQRTVSVGEAYSIGDSGQASQQQYSSLGVLATAADLTSETQYFPRGPLSQPVETVSDQDAYDRAYWSLAKYKQPQLRANEVSIDLASNPGLIDTVMRLEQGDVVTVNRRPLGAPVISLNCMIQKVEVHAGPDVFTVILTLSPYSPENAVMRLDGGTNSIVGNAVIPW